MKCKICRREIEGKLYKHLAVCPVLTWHVAPERPAHPAKGRHYGVGNYEDLNDKEAQKRRRKSYSGYNPKKRKKRIAP